MRLPVQILAALSLAGLASASSVLGDPAKSAGASVPVAVLPLGLTEGTHQRYPQLARRNVGFGIHNLLVDELAAAGRFRFVEDKKEVLEDLLERQWQSASGAVTAESAVAYGRLTGARYVVYGEVFDFSTTPRKRRMVETRISIQVRWIDVETSEYVPASGTGTVTVKGRLKQGADDTAFARSSIGQASKAAIEEAVRVLLERLRPATLAHFNDGPQAAFSKGDTP